MATSDDLHAIISSQRRDELLAAVAKELALTARLDHAEPDIAKFAPRLKGINELMIIVLSQLHSDLGGDPAYSDDAFVDVVIGAARRGHCESNLAWAVERSAKHITEQPPSP